MDALSQREFDTWREGDAEFKARVLGHLETQHELNLRMEGRISTVEAQQEKCAESVSRRTTWISAIVASVSGTIVGWLWR